MRKKPEGASTVWPLDAPEVLVRGKECASDIIMRIFFSGILACSTVNVVLVLIWLMEFARDQFELKSRELLTFVMLYVIQSSMDYRT